MSSTINSERNLYLTALVIFLAISAWGFFLHGSGTASEYDLKVWASAYQIIALFGGIVGLIVSKKWGGMKSLIGKAVFYFSIGLLLQVFGQSVNSYYNIFQSQDIPYPSLGDIGFMGSVFAYITGAYVLIKACGLRFSLRSIRGKIFVIGLPLVILCASYLFFLRGYEFDLTNKLKIALDFGYPLGQALYLALALGAFAVSSKFLGGIMKQPIFFLIIALVCQYISDFMFLYQANAGTWYAGGVNDYMYFVSYFLMTLALITMGSVFKKIKET
jgi:hypothetical protein